MSQFLHTRGFRFLQQDGHDAEDGYIFKVDLHYPTRFHNRHDYQITPELLVIDLVYPYNNLSTQQVVFPNTALQRKLALNLHDKVNYVVHYCNLKLYLQLGLLGTKLHRVLTFKQLAWLKTCINC